MTRTMTQPQSLELDAANTTVQLMKAALFSGEEPASICESKALFVALFAHE